MTERAPDAQSPVVDASAVALPTVPDEAAPLDFRVIYEAEFNYVYHTLRRLGIPDRDLEDLLHEVFLAFYRCLAAYDPARPLKPWLFGICFRVASDFRRKAQHRYEIPSDREDAPDRAPRADEAVEAGQRRALVQRALATLDFDRRAVFVMHDLDGHSMPEIQAVLGAPLNTLYSRLRLARGEFAQAVKRFSRGER